MLGFAPVLYCFCHFIWQSKSKLKPNCSWPTVPDYYGMAILLPSCVALFLTYATRQNSQHPDIMALHALYKSAVRGCKLWQAMRSIITRSVCQLSVLIIIIYRRSSSVWPSLILLSMPMGSARSKQTKSKEQEVYALQQYKEQPCEKAAQNILPSHSYDDRRYQWQLLLVILVLISSSLWVSCSGYHHYLCCYQH